MKRLILFLVLTSSLSFQAFGGTLWGSLGVPAGAWIGYLGLKCLINQESSYHLYELSRVEELNKNDKEFNSSTPGVTKRVIGKFKSLEELNEWPGTQKDSKKITEWATKNDQNDLLGDVGRIKKDKKNRQVRYLYHKSSYNILLRIVGTGIIAGGYYLIKKSYNSL